MSNLTDISIETTILMLNNSKITIGGKEFKISLEEFYEMPTFNLSEILNFEADKNSIVKRIKPFKSTINYRQVKTFNYYVASNYVFRNIGNIDKKNNALNLMCQFFDIEDRKEFTSGVTEFRNLKMEKTEEKQISKYAEYVYYNFHCFTDAVILKILIFSLYHPYEFRIDIDFDRIEDDYLIK